MENEAGAIGAGLKTSSPEFRWMQGRWLHTTQLAEEIRRQRDRIPRRKVGQYPIPGYMGHVPEHNPQSLTANNKRPSAKDRMLLFDLDQHSRGRTYPHYQGFRTQVENNVVEPPEPTKDTTYGYNNYRVQKALGTGIRKPPPRANTHTSTVKDFFHQGDVETVSDDGLVLAETFFKHARPYEGSLWTQKAEKALASRYI